MLVEFSWADNPEVIQVTRSLLRERWRIWERLVPMLCSREHRRTRCRCGRGPGARRGQKFFHPLERDPTRHSRPETSQDVVCETAIGAKSCCLITQFADNNVVNGQLLREPFRRWNPN